MDVGIHCRCINSMQMEVNRHMAERQQGTVKWFNNTKGFGFITKDSGGDIFVHYSAIEGGGFRALDENQRVEFTVGQGTKGPQAQEVVLIS